jgi:hypothetical protein
MVEAAGSDKHHSFLHYGIYCKHKKIMMRTPGPRYPRKMSVQLLMTFEQLMSGVVRSWTYKLIRLFYNAFVLEDLNSITFMLSYEHEDLYL